MKDAARERVGIYEREDQGVVLTVQVDETEIDSVRAGMRSVRRMKEKRGEGRGVLYGTFDCATKEGSGKERRAEWRVTRGG